jgi:hypothetical protein
MCGIGDEDPVGILPSPARLSSYAIHTEHSPRQKSTKGSRQSGSNCEIKVLGSRISIVYSTEPFDWEGTY